MGKRAVILLFLAGLLSAAPPASAQDGPLGAFKGYKVEKETPRVEHLMLHILVGVHLKDIRLGRAHIVLTSATFGNAGPVLSSRRICHKAGHIGNAHVDDADEGDDEEANVPPNHAALARIRMVCLPEEDELSSYPERSDVLLCYRVPPVLTDEFDTRRARLVKAHSVCVTADIADQVDPFWRSEFSGPFLICLTIRDAEGQPKLAKQSVRVVEAVFGPRTLTLTTPEILCLRQGPSVVFD